MVEKLGLNGNRWVTKIYVKCKRWAKAYLHGNFFGGMRSTQRAIMRIRQNEAKTESLNFHEEMKNAELFFVKMRVEHSWNDPSNMYIDFNALVNVPGFQQYEETITAPCEGGDPNNTPYENDMQSFCYSLME
ncbi:hypothetical protein CK203_105813 [Vitis vinifera]|uniref:Protein FAR1-RELATED SEQUENCE n=1 Tax=Vitis vinifera TaxID=29760 RepID=A0A438D7Q5_VITVI|nr:hypothetical protein CK203_105813 [Vitis vinifera]